MGMQMSMIARNYLAYDITGKATALGIVSVAWGVPMLICSLVGGVVADRVEKRNLLLVTQTCITLCYLAMAILVHTGVIQIWHLVVIGVFQGAVWAFNMPARQALLPELVGKDEQLMNALALNTGAMNATRVVAPAVAGALIAVPWYGMTGVFYTVVALDTAVLFALVQLPLTGAATSGEQRPMWEDMAVGLKYIRRHWALVVLLSMAFAVVLLGMSYQMLLPVFASDKVFDVGSFGYGTMNTFVGVGAILASLVMAYNSDYPHRATLQLVLGVGFGIAILLLGQAPTFFVALAVLSFMGFMSTSYMTLNNTLIFAHTEREFTGRVMSVYMMTWSLQPFAILPITGAADAVGVRPVVTVVGIALATVVAGVALLYPGYRKIGTPAAIEAERAEAAAGS
jgi:MFS family permease